MKLFSPKGRPLSRATAKNATLLNLLAWPGLGSLLARRWIAGSVQTALFFSGFVLIMVWFIKDLNQYYGMISGDVPPQAIGWIFAAGMSVCAVVWIWSAVTSFSLSRE